MTDTGKEDERHGYSRAPRCRHRVRSQLPDGEPSETQEWLESLDGPSIVLRTLKELIALTS